MNTINNVHQQFAAFFKSETLKPFAYLVSKKLNEGHICIALNDIDEETDIPLFYERSSKKKYQSILQNESLVTTKDGPKQPFVLHKEKLYMQRYFYYETLILNRLEQFNLSEKKQFEQRVEALKQYELKLFPPDKETKSKETINWQSVAAISAVLNNFTIITGGPGTGKTTTVAKILEILLSMYPRLKVALAAPTGKAAARMGESLKSFGAADASLIEKFKTLEPVTLHRLLKVSPGSVKVIYDHQNPLDFDLIIVDESSMIDVSLFAKLLNAVRDDARLILLGDKDQLASVEAGSLFGDLCNAQAKLNIFPKEKAVVINSLLSEDYEKLNASTIDPTLQHPLSGHVIELRNSHRFTAHEGIGRFSKAVISNDDITIRQFFKEDFDSQLGIDTTYSEELFLSFINHYKEYILEKDIAKALKKFNQVRVLCAVRAGNFGLHVINKKIETLLQKKGLIKIIDEFYEHRPVMVTKNYYDLQLFNGDTGIIRPDADGILKAWFLDSDQNLRSVFPGFIAESETVYAMTIHKSQGSEFDNVLVMLPDASDTALLTRELLYTAVTRAKQKVLIQGSEAVILETAGRSVKRISGIIERFEEISK